MKPDYLAQGEPARLFPVLATTSKEGRCTSIVLACLVHIDEFARELLHSLGARAGKRSRIEAFTEPVFREQAPSHDRPDGLIVLQSGKSEWRALVEAKVGNATLDADQVERYRALAKAHAIDCVITISNQFATRPESHPLPDIRKSRSRIPVFHWSWMYILTIADLQLANDAVEDRDQVMLLRELRRFLSHESTGVRGFDRMPPEWSEVNRLVSAGGKIPSRSEDAAAVLGAWHQESKDLSLILSPQTETRVTERLARKHMADPAQRMKDELAELCQSARLLSTFLIPDAAAPLDVVADLARRTVDVGMTLRAPEDRKSSRARMTWLLRQLKGEMPDDLQIRLNLPGRSEATQFACKDLAAEPGLTEQGKAGLQVASFHVFISRRLGGRFTQQVNFISDLETVVPEFYRAVGQSLSVWQKAAPKIKAERETADDVSVEALTEAAAADAGDAEQ